MKKVLSLFMAAVILMSSGLSVMAAEPADNGTAGELQDVTPAAEGDMPADAKAPEDGKGKGAEGSKDTKAPEDTKDTQSANSSGHTGGIQGTETPDAPAGSQNANTPGDTQGTQDTKAPEDTEGTGDKDNGQEQGAPEDTEKPKEDKKPVKGEIKVNDEEETEQKSSEVKGTVIVDENNDDVEIRKNDKPYLSLGADLSEEQRSVVLSLLGVNASDLSSYDVVTVTNAEEHQYLDSYIESSRIGSRSLSSVVIVKRKKGNGLNISTKNITYCTVGMYKNALTTAGVTDADIIVAGPTGISGTAALVGILKAYQEMTGEEIDSSVVDAALHELVLTGELEESIEGLTDQEVEEFVAYIKSVIAQNDLSDEASINEAIDEACEKYGVTLSAEERQNIIDFLLKITSLGIDLNGLVDYASSLYNSFKNGSGSGGFFASVGDFFSNVFSTIGDFFKNLFS